MSLTLFYNMYSRGAAIGDVTDETVSTTKIFANGDFGVWTHIVEIESNNLLTAALDNKKKLFFYNMYTRSGAFGFLESTTFTTITVFPEGSFGTWTHIAAVGQLIFFYDKNSGAGAIATTDDTKGIVTIKSYGQGSFGTWTHIVDSGPYLFFYNKNNRAGSIGKLSKEGLNTVKDFGNGSFGTWTHIAGATPYLLFYNKDNGAGSVGKLSDEGLTAIKDFPSGTFGQWTHLITGVSLIKQTKNKGAVPVNPFPGMPVDPNLPSLIEPNGAAILAYNSVSGAGALGHLSNDGFKIVHTFDSGSFGYWTSISDTSAHIWNVSDLLSSLRHKLIPGETLVIGQELYSQNLKFVLKMQSDGNLVLYRVQDAQALWATGTEGKGATRATMQKDGNLVLYNASVPVWASNTEKNAGALLKLQNDGNLVIYKGSAPIWDTGIAAKLLIKKKYDKLGGYSSSLGMPIDKNLDAQSYPVVTQASGQTGYSANFRGGNITLSDAETGDAIELITKKVKIWFVGLECRIRQEKTDEVFGSIGVIRPSTKSVDTHHFPEGIEYLSLGAIGNRTVSLQMLIYDDVPADIVLSCVLIEHDSGNIDEYKKKIAEALTKAAQAGLTTIGVPAEAVAADQGFIGDVSLGIVNVVSGWIGADDDPYNPQGFRISAKEILTKSFTARVLEREDHPGVILEYNTQPVIVSGTDQGGDLGEYGFYFKVEPYTIIEKLGG
jgi:hypothetical protein